jgi:hypothetical protein
MKGATIDKRRSAMSRRTSALDRRVAQVYARMAKELVVHTGDDFSIMLPCVLDISP